MKRSVLLRLSLALGACFLAGIAFVTLSPKEAPPDVDLLAARLEKSILLGWQWLHAENVSVTRWERVGKDVLADFSYTVIIDSDADTLTPAEQERFRTFLPMCAETTLAKGQQCQVTETMQFTITQQYGPIPTLFLLHRPDLVPIIATADTHRIQ